MILFIVTSHSQQELVFNQFVAIYKSFVSLHTKFTYLCVESSFDKHTDSLCFSKSILPFADFRIVKTDQSNFWCGSLFAAISSLSKDISLMTLYTRVVIMNCDVTLEDFAKLIVHTAPLESFVTYSIDQQKVCRSGLNQIVPFAPLHHYPNYGKHLSQSESFYCEIVPTRCVCMSVSAFLTLRSIDWLPWYLPHYGADFIVTKYISSRMDVKWFVRNDTYLLEDYTSTGLKPVNSSSLLARIFSIFQRKSVYNWRLFLVYPVIYCSLFLPFYYWILYCVSYWFKFLSMFVILKA